MQRIENLTNYRTYNNNINATLKEGDLNMINGTSAFKPINNRFDERQLETKGWERQSLGLYRTNGQIKEKEGFILYKRTRKLKDYLDDYSKKSSLSNTRKPRKNWANTPGLSSPLGIPEPKLTPLACKGGNCLGSLSDDNKQLPSLSSFSSYPSLMATRRDKPCLLIGYDSEWENTESGRNMISWQFAFVEDDNLIEFVFLKDGNKDLTLNNALGTILDHLDTYKPIDIRSIRSYKYCSEWIDNAPKEVTTDDLNEARNNCKYIYRDGIGFTKEIIQEMADRNSKRNDRDWCSFQTYLDYSEIDSINVCVVCHAGKVDLSALHYKKASLLHFLTDVHGGLVSLQPVRYAPRSSLSVNNTYIYPISLSISDTMCHAPAGKKKLKDLGEVLGIEKIDIPQFHKEHMNSLLSINPTLFMEYASTDSIVTLLYASAMYGYNNTLPVTITSATAKVIKEIMMKELNCESTEEFDQKYRGLQKVNHGKFKLENISGFIEGSRLEPISNDANTIQFFSSKAFHGGYNICSEVGYFPFETFDYDLKNAYPTAMCLVPDIDWSYPIQREIKNCSLTLDDFKDNGDINPIKPFVGYVKFKFPSDCKYPCIPITVEGIPQYPLTSDGMDGVYVAGTFIWLALTLGAEIQCERGYFLNVQYSNDLSNESRSLSKAVKQLILDRDRAKKENGKGSLEELILKTMVNSGYGKIAQNVVKKTAYIALKDKMEDLGCSAITNPVSAMLITSIVQVELIAAQNQLHELGYISCSVTTDGFISDCPEDVLKSLDLYGLCGYIESSREFLTNGDPNLWEIKHHQDDLVNFTTRGNVSLHCKERDGYEGVCAHNSSKSGHEPDSYDDRYWLMSQVLSRTGKIEYVDNEWTTFKELVRGKPLMIAPKTRHLRMDFDMKRKPVQNSFRTDIVRINDQEYKIAHFDTTPFKDISEFLLYRRKKELAKVLRTVSDWNSFWIKIALKDSKAQPRNLEWSILNSCIMGHRLGHWNIPALDDKSIEEKCEWINKHNTSNKKFKPSDWKNARRPERQVNMLPREMLKSKLFELTNSN